MTWIGCFLKFDLKNTMNGRKICFVFYHADSNGGQKHVFQYMNYYEKRKPVLEIK